MTDTSVPTLETEFEWCEQARLMLNKSRVFKKLDLRHELKSELAQVRAILTELQPLVAPNSFAEARRPFDAVAYRMHSAGQYQRQKQVAEVLKRIAGDLKDVIGGLKTRLQEAKRTSKAREAYEQARREAYEKIAGLRLHPDLFARMKSLIDAADQAVLVGTEDAYRGAKEQLGSAFASRLKAVEADRERLIQRHEEQIRERPIAENKHDEAIELLAQIRSLPGIEGTIQEFEQAIAEAGQQIARQHYIEATARLSALPNLEQVRALSEKAVAQSASAGELKAALAAAEKALAALTKLEEAGVVAEKRRRLDALSREVLGGGERAEGAMRDLQALSDELAADHRRLVDLSGTIEDRLENVRGKLEYLQQHAAPERVTDLAVRLDRVETFMNTQRIAAADSPSGELEADVRAMFATISEAVVKLGARDVPGLRRRLEAIREQWPAAPDYPELLYWLIQIEGQRDTDPVTALAGADVLAGQIDRIEQGPLREFLALEEQRKQLDEKVQRAIAEASKTVDSFEAQVREKRGQADAEGERQALEQRELIARQQQIWAKAKWRVNSATELLKIEGDVEASLAGIAITCSDADGVAAAQDRAAREAEFRRLVSAIKDGIEELDTLRRGSASAFEARLATVVQRFGADGATDQAIEGASSLLNGAGSVSAEIARLRDALETERTAAEAEQKKAKTAVRELDKALNGGLFSGMFKKDDFSPFIEKLKQELDDVEPLLRSSSESGIQEAKRLYIEAQTRAQKLAADMDPDEETALSQALLSALGAAVPGAVDPDAIVVSFADVIKDLAAIRALLENDELKNHAKSQLKIYQEQLKALEEKAHQSAPEESLSEIRAAKTAIQRFVSGLAARTIDREYVEQKAGEAKKAMKPLPRKKEYTKELAGRIDQIKATANTEGKESLARTQIDNLITDIRQAIDSTQVFDSNEQRLLQDQQLAVERAREVNARLAVAKEQIELVRRDVKAVEGDLKQVEELERLRGMAKDKVKKKDFDGAGRDLDLLLVRARVVRNNPHGAALGARKDLVPQLKILRQALSELEGQLGRFPGLVTDLDTENVVGADRVKSIRQTGSALAGRFDVKDLDGLFEAMAAKDVSTVMRRSLRETALTVLRREQKKLSPPAMVAFRDNVIDPIKLPQAIKKVRNSIERLVGNVQRSVQ